MAVRKYFFYSFLVALMLLCGLFSGLFSGPNGKSMTTAVKEVKSPNFKSLSVEQRYFDHYNKALNYSVNISFPYIVHPDLQVAHNVNVLVQFIYTGAIKEFEQRIGKNVVFDEANPCALKFDYEVVNTKRDILSIKFFRNTYYTHTHESKNLVLTLNYDLRNDKQLFLSDILRKGSEKPMAKQGLVSLANRHCRNCKNIKFKQLEDFALTDEGICFFLEPSFFEKVNIGDNKIMIPWKKLLKVIDLQEHFAKLQY